MTGADTVIGGPVHGSGARWHLPTTQPRRHGLEHGRRLACGPTGRGAQGSAKRGYTISAVVCDKSQTF